MKKLILPFAGFLLLAAWMINDVRAAREYGPTIYMDDVSVGSWVAISNLTATTTTGGTFTNGTYTNYYRVCATNSKGRLPLSTNVIFTFVGNTNSTNAVIVGWPLYAGVRNYVVERSYDAGSTWTNWTTLSPRATNFTDYGTNTWSTNMFTNLVTTLVPVPSTPWPTAGITSSDTDTWHRTAANTNEYLYRDGRVARTGDQDYGGNDLTNLGTNDPAGGVRFSGGTGIGNTNVVNWNTAYGWGDHASAGYAADSDLILNRHDISLCILRLQSLESTAALGASWRLSDYYVDQSGIDTGTGSNYTYSAAGDYYEWSYTTETLASDLRAHYKMNDDAANTTVDDTSTNDTDAALTNAGNTEDINEAGKVDGALNLDGNNDYIACGSDSSIDDLPSSSGLTVAMWVKLESNANAARIISKRNTVGWEFQQGNPWTAGFYLFTDGYGYYQIATNHFTLGQWTHLAFVIDTAPVTTNGLRIYINSVEPSYTAMADGDGTYSSDAAINLNIGAEADNSNPSDLTVDDVRIYGCVLSAPEIAEIFNSGNGTEATTNVIGSEGGNMLLQSTNDIYAAGNVSSNWFLMLVEDEDSDLTAGTDVLADISNDGATWSSVDLSDMGPYTGSTIRVWGGPAAPGGTGSNLMMRVRTANLKDGKIHGHVIMAK